jgi:hypothetical protein
VLRHDHDRHSPAPIATAATTAATSPLITTAVNAADSTLGRSVDGSDRTGRGSTRLDSRVCEANLDLSDFNGVDLGEGWTHALALSHC